MKRGKRGEEERRIGGEEEGIRRGGGEEIRIGGVVKSEKR